MKKPQIVCGFLRYVIYQKYKVGKAEKLFSYAENI